MDNSYIPSTSTALNNQRATENPKLWVEKNPEDPSNIRYNCLWNECQIYCNNIKILDEHINKHIQEEVQFTHRNKKTFKI